MNAPLPSAPPPPLADECLRCGYSLLGIANDQACPECGLIAERSRRLTDELHETRPQWLRALASGVWLLLVALVVGTAWPFVLRPMRTYFYPSKTWSYRSYIFLWSVLPVIGLGASAILAFVGAMLLTVREWYEPADRADRRVRTAIRGTALAGMLAMTLVAYQSVVDYYYPRYWPSGSGWQVAEIAAAILGGIGILPLPLLLFTRLRGLAKRARSAHLAEHCLIVGIGTTLALLYAVVATQVLSHGDEWFGDYWLERSRAVIVVMLVMSVLAGLFVLWSLYLLTRFGLAFARASRELRRKWKADDRALPAPAAT